MYNKGINDLSHTAWEPYSKPKAYYPIKGNMVRRSHIKIIILISLVLAAAIAVRLLHLDSYLTLERLKQSRDALQQIYETRAALMIATYFFIYVVVTALSIPGAAVMTLAGGAIFGLWTGVITVSFASTTGATLAFLASRFLLRDWVEEKFSDRLRIINKGLEKEGAFYLFTLRLIPVFPFFIINLVMGLTRMPASTFYRVSQLGMLPATFVYVNAGSALGEIEDISDIMSTRLLVSFVLLGILPLASRRIVTAVRARRKEIP